MKANLQLIKKVGEEYPRFKVIQEIVHKDNIKRYIIATNSSSKKLDCLSQIVELVIIDDEVHSISTSEVYASSIIRIIENINDALKGE